MESRPVYIELPYDMVSQQVSSERLLETLEDQMCFSEEEEYQHLENLLSMFYCARQPLLLVDRGADVPYMRHEINDFVKLSGIAKLTMPPGGRMVDYSTRNYFGVHSGPVVRLILCHSLICVIWPSRLVQRLVKDRLWSLEWFLALLKQSTWARII